MQTKRILLGGLVAGVVYTLGGLTIAALLDLGEVFAPFGVEPSGAAALLHLASGSDSGS